VNPSTQRAAAIQTNELNPVASATHPQPRLPGSIHHMIKPEAIHRISETQITSTITPHTVFQNEPSSKVQPADDEQKRHSTLTRRTKIAIPATIDASPHTRVACISHHIQSPEIAQNTSATITPSTLTAIILSGA
jgi:hypothetical protein